MVRTFKGIGIFLLELIFTPTFYAIDLQIAYCTPFKLSDVHQYQKVCESFVSAVKLGCPEMLNKPKVHLLLHLPQSMRDFGPTFAYNTER